MNIVKELYEKTKEGMKPFDVSVDIDNVKNIQFVNETDINNMF